MSKNVGFAFVFRNNCKGLVTFSVNPLCVRNYLATAISILTTVKNYSKIKDIDEKIQAVINTVWQEGLKSVSVYSDAEEIENISKELDVISYVDIGRCRIDLGDVFSYKRHNRTITGQTLFTKPDDVTDLTLSKLKLILKDIEKEHTSWNCVSGDVICLA